MIATNSASLISQLQWKLKFYRQKHDLGAPGSRLQVFIEYMLSPPWMMILILEKLLLLNEVMMRSTPCITTPPSPPALTNQLNIVKYSLDRDEKESVVNAA